MEMLWTSVQSTCAVEPLASQQRKPSAISRIQKAGLRTTHLPAMQRDNLRAVLPTLLRALDATRMHNSSSQHPSLGR